MLRTRTIAFVLVVTLAAAFGVAAQPAPAAVAAAPGLRSLLAETAGATKPVTAIATFDAIPSASVTSALRGIGLQVQPMHHLALALVRGPRALVASVVARGLARDVYPNDELQYLDTASSDAMGGAAARASGFTGKGVTVAVVDSGCDATHPDLADHVAHNVKLISPEYVNGTPDSSNTIVLPIDAGPYKNTDLGSGHGTHVAGIIAADGHTGPDHVGVAPDATLVCYSIGEVLFTTAVVTAYDHMLDQPDLWGIDVVNNSWGNLYQQYDPRNPVAVATKAVADLGVTVVFASGNAGIDNAEASLNPFSQAPWVVSVAAGTLDHQRGDFSSNGFRYDNSKAVTIGSGGHTTFTGNRIGLVHPDVTAPGVDISSTCDTLGTLVGPCAPGSNTTASGTSMASPHIAGAAAVLKQARPSITPAQIRSALQVTATPVIGTAGETGPAKALGFWEVGYGYVNLGAAVKLVRSSTFGSDLSTKQSAADQRVLRSVGFTVPRSDLWSYDAPRLTVGGTDSHTYQVKVPSTVTNLKVTVAHPSLAQVGGNFFVYDVTVKDAKGRVIGTSSEESGAGTSTASIDLRALKASYGTFTIGLAGTASISDPDTLDSDSVLGDSVTLQAVQLIRT
jgi:serine protease AprX